MARPSRVVNLPEFWILTVSSAVLHFWRLYTPNAVVFDELHYERFTGLYLTGSYLFDVHPPLGRMLFAAFAWLLRVDPSTFVQPSPAPVLRVLPAAFGTLIVPLVFLLLRQLGAGRRAATLAAIAILLDNALLVMSRFILPDSFLIVFGLGAVCAYLAARARRGGPRWAYLAYLATSAVLAGCALSVKWTGASGLGIVLAAWFADSLLRRAPLARMVREGAVLVAIPVVVYLTAWAVHFRLLDHTGPGDTFMSPRFQAQLQGSPQYNPAAPPMSFWTKLREVHHAIRYGNGQLQNIAHPGSSPWYTWPIMKHPIGFWEREHIAPDGSHTMVMLVGNPVVWWGSLLAAALGIAIFLAGRGRFAGREYGFLLLLAGTLLNYVPFMAIARVMYLYHYLFALVWLVALAAFSVGALEHGDATPGDEAPWTFSSRRSATVYTGVLALMLAGFVYFLPFTYGWTLSAASWDQHFRVLHPL